MHAVAQRWKAKRAQSEAKDEKVLKALEPTPEPAQVVPAAVNQAKVEATTAALVGTLNMAVPAMFGAHLRLDEERAKQMREIWAPVVALYLPAVEVHPIWIALGGTAAIYAPLVLAGPPKPVEPQLNQEAPIQKAA